MSLVPPTTSNVPSASSLTVKNIRGPFSSVIGSPSKLVSNQAPVIVSGRMVSSLTAA